MYPCRGGMPLIGIQKVFKRERVRGRIPLINFHQMGRDVDAVLNFLLTPEKFNGKNLSTLDALRQRRFTHRTSSEVSDDGVLNQENLDEGFFFAFF